MLINKSVFNNFSHLCILLRAITKILVYDLCMIVLMGASASGKTEVAKMLGTLFSVKKVVTHTTREMRVNEENGRDYHFVTKEEFKRLEANDYFVETVEYNGNFYGTSKDEIAMNKVLIIEPTGLKPIKSLNSDHIVVFFMQASRAVRRKRMINRGDNPKIATERILIDDAKFNPKNIEGIDFTIDSEHQNVKEIAIEVYEKYALKLVEPK
jgi:guanylate kinase